LIQLWLSKRNKYLLFLNLILNITALTYSLFLGNGWLLSLAYMFFCGAYYLYYILLTKNLLMGTLVVIGVIITAMIAENLGKEKVLSENSN